MSTFAKMAEIVPEGTSGSVAVQHFMVGKEESAFSGFRPGEYVPPGRYCRLMVSGAVMMSDTPMEQRSNYEVVRRARGRVLIAGLGIGMVLVPILRKPDVDSVTVVEKNPDVIRLVRDPVRLAVGAASARKLTVIEADAYTWKPAPGEKFDAIYFDIWPDYSTDTLAEMARLHQRARTWKAQGAWMDSWMRESLLSRRRREQRHGWY